jgi:ATP phosphoribosyltransferase regulatory subunit
VILPIPSGTRDVLPDEMRELRAITEAIRGVFDEHGYGEVWTPALEYEEVLQQAGTDAERAVYRMFDEHGKVLTLRWDMTIPIARVVASRYAAAEPPLRFSYFAHAYRDVRPQRGQPRELLQAGIELVGSPTPEGTVEALTILCRALDAAGLRDYRVGLGDAALYPALMEQCSVPEEARSALLGELATRDFVGLERRVRDLGLGAEETDRLVRVPQQRGGREILDAVPGPVSALRTLHDRLAPQVAERVIFDLGLVRQLGYYTGAVFEVYDPALGAPIGRGGRYDDLLGRFGRPLPAVGFALGVDRLHIALHGEERGVTSTGGPSS